MKIHQLRLDFNKEYELSPYEQFLKFKCRNSDFCDKDQLSSFLMKYNFVQSQLEIDILFDRFDHDRDGKFYFSEVLSNK